MTRLIDVSAFCLLAAGLVVSVIELGLSADVVSWFNDSYDDHPFESRSDFLLFCSIWSILVTGLLVAVPFVRQLHSHRLLAHVTLVLTTVTMLFWLAGFAAFADLFNDPMDTVGATLAFAILAWLIYLGLLGLNLITAFSFSASDRPGFTPFARVTRVEKSSSGSVA